MSLRRTRNRIQSGHGPPVFAILIFVAFSVLVLAFVTLRQLHAAEQRSLRLLGGYSHRIETTVEDLIRRFVQISSSRPLAKTLEAVDEEGGRNRQDGQSEPEEASGDQALAEDAPEPSAESIQSFLRNIQHLELLDADLWAGSVDPDVSFEARSGKIYLQYRGLHDSDSPQEPSGGEGDAPRQIHRIVRATLALDSIARPLTLEGVFDSVFVTDPSGQVVIQHGEPELRAGKVSYLLGEEEGKDTSGRDVTGMVEVEIADQDYRLFMQPLTIDVASGDDGAPTTLHFTAYGLVTSNRLLSTSFLSSPILLLFAISIFPAGMIAWPLLKIWLMAPRQPFTRVDMTFLLICCVLGLSLLTLLAFTVHFYLNLRSRVADHVEGVAEAVVTDLRYELREIHQTLAGYSQDPEAVFAFDRALRATGQFGQVYAEVEDGRLDLDVQASEGYPYLHALYLVDGRGRQVALLPFDRFSANRSPVGTRRYFDCARKDGGFSVGEVGGRLCMESILSNTSGRALAAVAIPIPEDFPEEHSKSDELTSDLPGGQPVVVAATTELLSITSPALPENYHLALVDSEGQVQFHSEPSRNLNENLLKSTDRDDEIAELLRADETGTVVTNYSGLEHVVRVRSIVGLPWSLVVLRRTTDVRQRSLEVLLDFANPFSIQILVWLILVAIGVGALYLRRVHRPDLEVSHLWPDDSRLPAYDAIVLGAPVLLVLVAWFFEAFDVGIGQRFYVALFWPFAVAGLAFSLLVWVARKQKKTPEEKNTAPPASFLSDFYRGYTILSPLGILLAVLAWIVFQTSAPLSSKILATLGVVVATSGVVHWGRVGEKSSRRPGLCTASGLAVLVILFWVGIFYSTPFWTLALTVASAMAMVRFSYRMSFFGKQRRRAYVFALCCVLFLTGVIPTAAFLQLARERQTQLFVQATQAALAESWWRRQERFPSEEAIDGDPFWRVYEEFGWPRRSTKTERNDTAADDTAADDTAADDTAPGDSARDDDMAGTASEAVGCVWCKIFGTHGPSPHADCQPCSDDPERSRWSTVALWPQAGAGSSAARVARWMSRRPVTIFDRTSMPTGADFSRFSLYGEASRPDSIPSGLTTSFEVGPTDRSVTLTSRVPDLSGFPEGILRSLALLCGLLVIPLAAFGFAFVVAEKVLQISLVPPHVGGGVLRLPVLQQQLTHYWKNGVFRQPLFVVTSTPDLAMTALRSIKETVEPAESHAGRPPVWDLRWLRLAREDGSDTDGEEEWGNVTRREIAVVTHFRPELDVHERADDQIRRLTELVERGGPTIVVSRIDPRDLEARRAELYDAPPAASSLTACERWQSFLARFTVYYLRSGEPLESFHQKIEEKIERLSDDVLDSDAVRASSRHRAADMETDDLDAKDRFLLWVAGDRRSLRRLRLNWQDLETTLERECGPTGWLQELGAGIAGLSIMDSDPALSEDPESSTEMLRERHSRSEELTAPQLIARITHMARAYYASLWSACRTDEQVVLHQLARYGFANPSSFHVLSDLLHKGLVVRDPVLGVMNESFARFIRQTVSRSNVVRWEEEEGTSAWSVLKWLLPLPLLLLGGFLFVTQGTAFSNLVGLIVALGSVLPTFHNIFEYFQRLSVRERGGGGGDSPAVSSAT